MVEMNDEERKRLLKLGEVSLVFTMLVVLFAVFSRILRGIVNYLGIDDPFLGTLVPILLGLFLIQVIVFGGLTLAYLFVRDLDIGFLNIRVPSLRDIAWVVLGFGLLIAMVMVFGFIFQQAGIESARNVIQEQGEQAPIVFLLLIPLSFLLVGPAEELLFRGVIQGSLREVYGPVSAIAIASLLFSVLHFFSLIGQGSRLVYILVVFGLSLILGAAYERTDNIVVPSVIHGAYNAFQFLVMYLLAKGLVPAP